MKQLEKMLIRKFTNPSLIILSIIALFSLNTTNAQVGIGTTSPDASASLELQSTTKGFLPPRMDTDARNDINSPAEGLTIYNTDEKCLQWYDGASWYDGCGNNPHLNYPEGFVFCENGATEVVEVTSTSGKIWMDRNLGASQAATASDDTNAYGDLYQWGRGADGHQCKDSETTTTISTTIQPAHGEFILTDFNPRNWHNTSDANLWQGVNGVNNPCPDGFRIPTRVELNEEREAWSSDDSTGAFNSPLKFTKAGGRNNANGDLFNTSVWGFYWSSDRFISGNSENGIRLAFSDSSANSDDENAFPPPISWANRALGNSIRCIKDY